MKRLMHCTYEDRFTIGDGPTVWSLALVPASEGLLHLGEVCITDGEARRWMGWNSQVKLMEEPR